MTPTTRFRVLALDHDDTTVNSTPEINYPAFVDILQKLRPGVTYDYDTFMELCFDPGFDPLMRDILHFTDSEMKLEYDNWRRWVAATVPSACDGIGRIISRQRAAGGFVCVVSHSVRENILRDWNAHFGGGPDAIYGWELGENRRKPHPYPLLDISEKFGVPVSEILMVDDLKPGYDMARAAGAAFAAAGWGEPNEKIRRFMIENCENYFDTTAGLEAYLFS